MDARGARLFGAAMALSMSMPAWAHGDDHDRGRTRLSGFEEVPALSTAGRASFEAKVERDTITYELSYRDLESAVTQSHIHFGQKSVNGGISVFLCSNLGNGPAGTQPCPPSGTVTGTIRPADVSAGAAAAGAVAQGIAAGEFAELVKALRAGVAYTNVHSSMWPGGEIRGQLGDRDQDEGNNDGD